MHATAAQFHHARAQSVQTGQVKLGVAVGAAHTQGLRRREHTVGANDLLGGLITHQQMLTKIIKQVHIVARQSLGNARTHLQRKHLVTQALGLPDFVQMPGPGHRQSLTTVPLSRGRSLKLRLCSKKPRLGPQGADAAILGRRRAGVCLHHAQRVRWGTDALLWGAAGRPTNQGREPGSKCKPPGVDTHK